MRIRPCLLPLLALLLASCASHRPASQLPSATSAERATAGYLEAVRGKPPLLYAFLRRFPKGGDLHNHLSGEIYAESFIAWALAAKLCVDPRTFTLVAPPCDPGSGRPLLAEALKKDRNFYSATVDAFSMRNLTPGKESGHDHFFATFAKFGAAGDGRTGDMLAEAASRAADNSELYLELMLSPGMSAARDLGRKVGWSEDLIQLRSAVIASGMDAIVASARRILDAAEARMREILGCGTSAAKKGCAVTIRYLAQVIRIFPPEQVFAQSVLAYELARADSRVVGLDLVAPEDDPVTLRDYRVQMRILGFLGRRYPGVMLTLHAGELAPPLVPPEQMRFHIREAVEVAGASRIGHGVDVMHEDDPQELLREMARRRVLVEINLTSNDVILGVGGDRHPFPIYRQFGVPVAISTDDEGVARSDLSREYLRAVESYGLAYGDLKTLARNSLEYAFLPGASLWESATPFAPVAQCAGVVPEAPDPPSPCRDYLATSEKARAQWRLETALAAFESEVAEHDGAAIAPPPGSP